MRGSPMTKQADKGLAHRGMLRLVGRNNPEVAAVAATGKKTPYVVRHPWLWLLSWPARKGVKFGARVWVKSALCMRIGHGGAPFGAAWWIFWAAALMHLLNHLNDRLWLTTTAVCVLACPFFWWRLGCPLGKLTHRRPMRRRYRVGYLGVYVTGSAQLVLGALIGPWGNPMPVGLIVWALLSAWAVHWWGAPEGPKTGVEDHEVREDLPADAEQIQLWKKHLAVETGPLAHSEVSNLQPVKRILPGSAVPKTIGWRVQGSYVRGKGVTSVALTKVEHVAAVYDTKSANVSIEPNADSDRKFQVTVFTDNPLQQTWHWPGAGIFNHETGIAPIGMYADVEQALYRFYRRGSGPVHDLIAGTTDSGKSRLMDLLLAYERATYFIASVVIDPQQGQSLPAWKSKRDGTHRTAGFATNLLEAKLVLNVLYDEMIARNAFLASVGWTDEDGFDEEGVDAFDPLTGPSSRLKLVSLTIEEAHAVLADPALKNIVEAIAKMARKCGIKLRLVVQVPLLDQLGGSTTLRDMVAAGNVIVLRTANALSGQVAFNGNMPVDPKSLPREWETVDGNGEKKFIPTSGLGYVLGPGARSVPARMFFTEKIRAHAREGVTTELKLLDPKYKGRTLNEVLGLFRAGEITADGFTVQQAVIPTQTTGGPVFASTIPADGTAWDKIAAVLDGRHLGAAPGLIAQQAGIQNLPTVSTTLARAAERGLAHKLPSGWWKLGAAPAVAQVNGREHAEVGS